MRKILHGLLNGDIIPWERRVTHSEESLGLIRKIEEEERYFEENMSPDDYRRFEGLFNLKAKLWSTEDDNLLSYAFSLGVLLMRDVTEEEKLITGE